jgi:hypothetical protein
MQRLILSGLALVTGGATLAAAVPAQADFGDFLLGIGVTAGVGAIVDANQRANEAQRQQPVTAQDEYYRGVQDGTNGLRYDNPRDSANYDQGYSEGLQRRQGG